MILFSFVNWPAPSGVMVPSLTASGYLVSWKWRRAWLFPPEPSKYLRPHSTFPSVRFIQIFSWRSHTSHRQPLQCRETKVLMKECYINWWGENINYISFLKCIHFLQLHVGLFYAKKRKRTKVSSFAYRFSTVSYVTSTIPMAEHTILHNTPPPEYNTHYCKCLFTTWKYLRFI